MSYIGKNPRFEGTILTDQVAAAVTAPASGSHKIVNRNGQLYTVNSSGTETPVGTSEGEKNYIGNPSAKAAITGWTNVGDLAVARTTTAADLPREYTTASGIKITADADTQSTADYVYYDFTLDDVDQSKRLKIQWSQKTTGTYTAGQLAVVITTQADRTTALHTPITTAIPASDGVFITSFDASTTATLSLVIRATTDMTTDGGIVISDVIVGPGVITQGAVVGPWTTYTPTGAWVSNTTFTGKYRRVGDSLEVYFDADCTGAPTSASFTVSLPSGLTIDTSALPNTSATALALGEGTILDSGTRGYPAVIFYYNTTSVKLYCAETTGSSTSEVTQANPITFGAADNVTGHFTVPIAEWAGSGTVNLAQNTPEFCYNSSTSTSANDTSSFAYGPAGALIQNISATIYRDVTLQYPAQVGDIIDVQVSSDRTVWQSVGSRVVNSSGYTVPQFGYTYNGASYRGIGILPQSSTVMRVYFGEFQTTYSSTNVSWATGGGGALYWRVLHAPAGSAVGFGIVTDTSSGLMTNPSSLGDAAATMLGMKQYLHGGSYSGGGAPTVTYSSGGGSLSSVTRASFVPYKMQDGTWRMRFNIVVVASSTSRTDYAIAVNGVTFKNVAGDNQAISGGLVGVAGVAVNAAYVSANTGNMNISHATSTGTGYVYSGDVELESKPTWAY